MTKYIENVNAYLSQMKIKQTYVNLKTGIDTKKLSRILTGAQDINATDMEKIAFYAGDPTDKQDAIAEKLEKLMENIDEVMSAKRRFLNMSR